MHCQRVKLGSMSCLRAHNQPWKCSEQCQRGLGGSWPWRKPGIRVRVSHRERVIWPRFHLRGCISWWRTELHERNGGGGGKEWELSKIILAVVAKRNSCRISQWAQHAHVTRCYNQSTSYRISPLFISNLTLFHMKIKPCIWVWQSEVKTTIKMIIALFLCKNSRARVILRGITIRSQ